MSPPHPVILLVAAASSCQWSPGSSPVGTIGLPLATVLIDGRCWATMSTVVGCVNHPSGMTLHPAKGDSPALERTQAAGPSTGSEVVAEPGGLTGGWLE